MVERVEEICFQLTPCTRMPEHWHTWTRPQGAQPLTYGSCHTWRSVFIRAICVPKSFASVYTRYRDHYRIFIRKLHRFSKICKAILRGYTGSTAISLGIGDIAWIGYQSKGVNKQVHFVCIKTCKCYKIEEN
jgi:hypothetical protein